MVPKPDEIRCSRFMFLNDMNIKIEKGGKYKIVELDKHGK